MIINGYKISDDGGITWKYYTSSSFLNGTPWVISNEGYWLSSPWSNSYVSGGQIALLFVKDGMVNGMRIDNSGNYYGFRPVVCLESDLHLEPHITGDSITYTIEED